VGWKLTVRSGPRVKRRRFGDLQPALEELEAQARELARSAPREAVNVRVTRFEPADRIVARLELAGPERLMPSVRGGVDVHGDGSLGAFRGRVRRRELAPRRQEDALGALRRALTDGGRV
jgi:hypothetical protein